MKIIYDNGIVRVYFCFHLKQIIYWIVVQNIYDKMAAEITNDRSPNKLMYVLSNRKWLVMWGLERVKVPKEVYVKHDLPFLIGPINASK